MASPAPSTQSGASAADALAKRPLRPRLTPRVAPTATDDEILGLSTNGLTRNLRRADLNLAPSDESDDESSNASDDGSTCASDESCGASAHASDAASPDEKSLASARASDAAVADPAHLQAALDANPELRAAWNDAQAYRETFATPQEARAATGMLADLNRMDALFFSHRPEDHAQLARSVAELDPVAFASLARAMSQVAQSAGVTFPAIAARAASASHRPAPATPAVAAQHAAPGSSASTPPAERVVASSSPAAGVTPAQQQFFHAANAAAVEGVLEAIESQVERLLPEGISKSARNRLVGEIYRELDSTLRANRTLTQQARDAFRGGALDANHQKAVVSLITGRARQALPAVAKRVLNEWTSTVVSANRQSRERQRTAERRVDLGGTGGAGNLGRQSIAPREINYARMSDADILNL